jgi:hypothetical protein
MLIRLLNLNGRLSHLLGTQRTILYGFSLRLSICAPPSTGSGRAGLAVRGKPRPFVLSVSKQERAAVSWIKIMWNPYNL